MSRSVLLPGAIVSTWRSTGLTGRLATGVLAIVLFTLAWEQMGMAFDVGFSWPMTGLVAAAGWARLGLSVRPMSILVVLGFIFDAVTQAPFGVHPLVFLTTYASLASMGAVIGGEMDPLTGAIMPHLGMALGMLVLWIFASVLAGGAVEVLPMFVALAVSSLLYLLFEAVFDLDSAKTAAKGG